MKSSTLRQAILRNLQHRIRDWRNILRFGCRLGSCVWRGAEKQNRSTPLALPIRCCLRGQVWLARRSSLAGLRPTELSLLFVATCIRSASNLLCICWIRRYTRSKARYLGTTFAVRPTYTLRTNVQTILVETPSKRMRHGGYRVG